MSELDLGKIKFVWQGDWSGGTSYEKDDVVYRDGSAWIAIAASSNVQPSTANNAYWAKMAQGSDLGAITGLAAGSLIYHNGSDFVHLGIGSDGTFLRVDGTAPAWEAQDPPVVVQENFYADRSSRTTGNGGVYYFGMGSNDLNIEMTDPANTIHVAITYFGESNAHDTHTRLQFSVDNAASWSNVKLGLYGQTGTMKVGNYPDGDYNSTPHSVHAQFADVGNQFRSDAGRICFRMYHFNGGTFYHNRSVSTSYESGPSLFVVREVRTNRMYWR